MPVPLPTGTYTVVRPGATGPADPVPGHATYRGGSAGRTEAGSRVQVGAWTLLLDAAAWPVTEADTVVHVETGTGYRVNSAALRAAGGRLEHVTVDADVTTADTAPELGADDDGNVWTIPQGAP